MPARKPDFFIIGAPKCGTTSLASWLSAHPQVCMSRPKEPHYFSPNPTRPIRTLAAYERCFAHAQPQHAAIGEASTHTLYYPDAIEAILHYQPQAKFIVCLRNPCEMAISLHNMLFHSREHGTGDFIAAWNSTEEVFNNLHDRTYRLGDMYRDLCELGRHYEALARLVPAGRLLAVVIDDMIAHESDELGRVADFIGVRRSSAPFPRENAGKTDRVLWLREAAEWLARAKRRLGLARSLGIGGRILRANQVRGAGVAALTPEIRAVLADHFMPDIALLGRLLGRDLSHWTAPALERT